MIEDILPRYQETANGTKKSFTLPFDVIDSKYIMVYTNQTKQTSGFSITNQELVFDSVPAAGTIITAVRVIPIDWEDYNYGALDIDKIVTLIVAKMQTLEEQVDRSLKVNIYDDSTQTVEFFLQQLADAQSVLQSAQDKLDLITSTGNSAITNINSAKEEAVQSVNEQVTAAESAAESASASATSAKASLDSIETARDDAINTFNENATTKTSDYNDNATVKLDAYNSNADSRTTIFNTNAQTKMDSIDASVKSAAGSASAAAASAEEAAKYSINIAQNLDSPSSDTVPSTQAVADESSRLTSIMVNKSGDTMTGKLGLLNARVHVTSSAFNQNPSSASYTTGMQVSSLDGVNHAFFSPGIFKNNDIHVRLVAQKHINDKDYWCEISAAVGADGGAYTTCPASNLNNSILTTLAHGYNYVKLGNGLILQWGIIATNLGSSGASYNNITFPIPFSDTNYRIFTHITATTSDYTGGISANQPVSALMKTTGFKLTTNINCAMMWFAIGW